MIKKTENKSKKRLVKRSRKASTHNEKPDSMKPETSETESVSPDADFEKSVIHKEKKKIRKLKKNSDKEKNTIELENSDAIECTTGDIEKRKEKKVADKNRKVNNKPLTSEKTGINVSPAKVKNIISNYVLNDDIYKAINELKYMQRNSKNITEMSDETKLLVSNLNEEIIKVKRKQYERSKYESFSAEEKKRYLEEKNKFKSGLTKYDKCVFNDTFSYDIKEFNLTFDNKYYDEFSYDLSYANDYDQLIKAITKSKYRFSNNSRLYLSSFIELLIRQIAYNSIYTCIKNDRKIIQVEHNLTKNDDLVNGEYSLFNLVRNLKVSKDYESGGELGGSLILENLTKEKQHQFKYYISETCREIKHLLAEKYPDSDNVYNHTSISKNFKNYGSSIVCEVIIIIGKMIRFEIESRSVKTVNDGVIKTVLAQLHLSNSIDFKGTSDFINSISKKYNEYITTKKDEKVKKTEKDEAVKKTEKDSSESDIKLEYEPEKEQSQ